MTLQPLLQEWLEGQQGTLFHTLSLSLLLSLSLFFLLKLLNGAWFKKLNLPPSPSKLPIIGNLHHLGTHPHRSLRALSQKHGPLMLLHLGHAPTLVVSSPDMAKEIMKTHDIVFANRPFTTAAKKLLYNCTDVGFSPYGDYWRQMRKICVLELLSMKSVQSFQFVREEEVASMVEKIIHSSSAGASINLSEMLLATSNNVVSRCALGRKCVGEDGMNKFGEVSREVMVLIGAFSFGDFFPFLRWMDVLTGLDARMKKVFRTLDAFLDEVIEEHKITNRSDEQSKQEAFVDILLHVQKDSTLDINLTRDNIKAIIVDMFVGGSDTMATTMEWAMAELVKNPNMMRKAQEEVRRVVGKKSKVYENDVNEMNFLKSIIKETLRLHAPVPMLVPRESTKSIKMEGYDIPPKTRVFINAWAIQRDSKLWDRAEEFLPDRFSNNPIDFKGQDFEFIPFGAGRRGCPGMPFGIAVVEFVLANLLYWFDWELSGGANREDLDMAEAFGLTVYKKVPLNLVPKIHST